MCDIWVMCLLQITVMCVRVCVCIWIWIWMWSRLSLCLYTSMMQHFVRMPVRNAFLCVYIWQAGGCFWQSSHSYPLCPYMMSRMKTLSLFDDTGPAVSFYDVRKWRKEGRWVHWVWSKTRIQPTHTRSHRPQGLRWLSYLLTGEKPANCDKVCLCIFTFVWGIVRKVGLFWIPRLLLYC